MLRTWYSRGTKLARLAEGGETFRIYSPAASHRAYTHRILGSVYMLMWLAYADLRAPFVEADGTLATDAANILRCPDPGES